jgi:hypothetical protein
MKYISENELDSFNFHDAVIKNISINETIMSWVINQLNVSISNSQNNCECDMEANELTLVFKDFEITYMKSLGYENYNENGNLLEEIQDNDIDCPEYINILNEFSESHGRIQGADSNCLKAGNPFSYSFDVDLATIIYRVDISFKSVLTIWDDYTGKAWYVK